jgi:glycosyltransferase involved in cell wall biosynthesis
MRVGYICADPEVPVFGRKACSIHVQEVIRMLIRRGVEVDLFAMRLDGSPPSDLTALRIHMLPAPPNGDLEARERAALLANDTLYEMLDRAGSFDLIYERYSLWSYSGMQYAYEHGTPGLLEVNAPLIEEQVAHQNLAGRCAAERVAGRVFGAAAALLAASEQIAAYLERFPAARGRVHIVPNGVDPKRFPVRPHPRAAGGFTIGFVGSLKSWRGLPILLRAFARLREVDSDARLLIVGDGVERESIEVDLARRGLRAAAHFTGAVDPGVVPGLLAEMDVAVASYPQHPNFYCSPLNVYEYMAAGLPVVASRIGQLDGLIEHGRTGLLCPPGDAGALADALTWLSYDSYLRAMLGRAARTAVLRAHTWDTVIERVLRIAGTAPIAMKGEASRGFGEHGYAPTSTDADRPSSGDQESGALVRQSSGDLSMALCFSSSLL